jgi:hypothetical protein
MANGESKKTRGKLEDKLSSMLDQNGGLLSVDQIPKFVKFMLKEDSVDGQSLLLTVLLSTKDSLRLNKYDWRRCNKELTSIIDSLIQMDCKF